MVPPAGVTEYVPTAVGIVALGPYVVPLIPAYEYVSELTVPVSLLTNPVNVERGEYCAVGLKFTVPATAAIRRALAALKVNVVAVEDSVR